MLRIDPAGGRLDPAAFAAANGLDHEEQTEAPALGGAVFGALEDAVVTDRFSRPGEFEVGNVEGTIGGSRTTRTGFVTIRTSVTTSIRRRYGYLSMRLPRVMPHLVLDARRNDTGLGSSLPLAISKAQRLSLEGDFDRSFRLYCPAGYERDALYVFTPDFMAVLVDETGDLDVEIVDDRLFVYAAGGLDLADPRVWARLDTIMRIVGEKALDRTERYADERSATAGLVAEEGRRLDQRFLPARPGAGLRPGLLIGVVVGGVVTVFGAVAVILIAAFAALP